MGKRAGGLAQEGGVGPVVTHVSVLRRGGGVLRTVLERGALVFFALDTTHRHVWRERERERERESERGGGRERG